MLLHQFTDHDKGHFSLAMGVDSHVGTTRLNATGATGFDGVSEAVAACSGRRAPDKTLDKIPTANNNFALAA